MTSIADAMPIRTIAAMVQTMRRWSGSYDQSRGSLSRAKPTNIRVDRQAAPTCGQPV